MTRPTCASLLPATNPAAASRRICPKPANGGQRHWKSFNHKKGKTKMKKNKKLLIGIGIFALFVIVSLGIYKHQQHATKDEGIHIGVILPLTGSLSSDGARLKAAISLAEGEQSRHGPKVSFRVEDGKYTIKDSINGFNKLQNRGVDAWLIFGDLPLSGLKSFIESDKKPTVCLIGDQEIISKMNNCIHFSQTFITPALKIADYAGAHDLKKAAILYQDIDLGKVVSNAFKDRYLKNEGKIIFEESFRQEQVDPKSIVAKAISVNPDAIFVYANGIAYTEILNQLKQQSFSGEVLTCSTMTVVKDKLINGGENFIYADIDFGAGSSNAKSDEFSQKMIEKYSLPANSFAAFAYEASKAMIEALKQHGTDVAAVCEELNKTQKQQSAVGAFSCHKNGELEVDIVIKRATKDGAVIIH